jgi:glycosyltransferase involved in cell wall biosynthesis
MYFLMQYVMLCAKFTQVIMKIIQLCTFFHPSVGGVERQIEEIAARLPESGYDVEVFTTNANHDGSRRQKGRENEFYRGVKINRFNVDLPLSSFYQLSFGLVKQLWNAEFDVLHVHNSHDAHLLPAMFVCLWRKKKLILTGHNPYVVDGSKRNPVLQFFVWGHDVVMKIFNRAISSYIALLPSEKVTVTKKLGIAAEKVAVIPNGIQDEYYTEKGDAEKFLQKWQIKREKWKLVVGLACRMNFVKGVQNLRQAVAESPKVLFVFAGADDGYLSTLRKIYAKYDNVLFTNRYLSTSEMLDFYAALDVFLLPSMYEPFGLTVVEAMAQGKPVLATSAGGPLEIISASAGQVLDPRDQAAWKDAIRGYIDNPEILEAQSAAAVQRAGQYTWSKVIRQIDELYKQL